jgi:hypothetical protein
MRCLLPISGHLLTLQLTLKTSKRRYTVVLFVFVLLQYVQVIVLHKRQTSNAK